MGGRGPNTGLRTIFSFFLGLMFAVFVGLGVYTFYPSPKPFASKIQENDDSQQAIRRAAPSSGLSLEDRDRLQELSRQRSELTEAAADARKPWAMKTSIILIVLSTLALTVSLVRADQLSVISNGLLLGGVFTMLYGIGWIVGTDTSVTRFLVMTAAFVVTIGFGYARFVNRGKPAQAVAGAAVPAVEGLKEVERRVGDLERRMNDAAHALAETSGDSNHS